MPFLTSFYILLACHFEKVLLSIPQAGQHLPRRLYFILLAAYLEAGYATPAMQHDYEFNKQYSVDQPRSVPFVPTRTIHVTKREWISATETHKKDTKIHGRAVSSLPLSWQKLWERARCSRRSIFGLPILRPDSALVTAWFLTMAIVDLSYTAFLVPISIAFDESIQGSRLTWMAYLDLVGTGFYIFDILFNLHVGYVVSYDVQNALVMRGTDVAWFYARHGTFLIDLLSTVAIIPQIIAISIEDVTEQAFRAFSLIRLLRLLRVTRLLASIWNVSLMESTPVSRFVISQLGTAGLFLLKILFAMCALINLLGCMWWFVAELEGLDESWVAYTEGQFKYDLLNDGDVVRYVTSIYFALTTLTTVGYGDITPVTVPETCLVMLYMMSSLFYFGYIVNVVGTLLSLLSRTTQNASMLRDKLEETEHWMKLRHIPKDLMQAVRRYYHEDWAVHGSYDDAGYFAELPVGIRVAIVKRLAGEALEESKMLRRLGEDVKTHLASTAVPLRLLIGHDLFTEGEPADSFYVLQEGSVVRVRGMHEMGAVSGLAILGQSAVFAPYIDDAKERMYTVRALTNCSLWVFNAQSLARLGKHHPEIQLVLCESYLEYLEGLKKDTAQQRQPPRKRLQRIKKQVKSLLRQAQHSIRENENRPEGLVDLSSLSMRLPGNGRARTPEEQQFNGGGETGVAGQEGEADITLEEQQLSTSNTSSTSISTESYDDVEAGRPRNVRKL